MGLLEDLNFGNIDEEKPTEPGAVFSSLNQEPGYDYLRSIQKEFLDNWYKRRTERDLIGILGTGTGKTLIGLLTLQSQLNGGNGPCAYVCPTRQLVNQVVNAAQKFGIKVVTFSREDHRIPAEFTNCESILVMTFDKLFNGKSVFGVDTASYEKIGSLVIDDAHTAINKIKAATTLTIPKDSKQYNKIFSLFEHSLNEQQPAKVNGIKNDATSNAVIQVPYWDINSKKQSLMSILEEYSSTVQTLFQYSFILEAQELLNVYISNKQIDIRPQHAPINMIPSFDKAEHRLFLSATFSNAGAFISELHVAKEAVDTPIKMSTLTDTGEKWFLAFRQINSDYTDELISSFIQQRSEKQNVLILTPSNEAARKWKEMGARFYSADNINELKQDLTSCGPLMAVIANKYDGIDLPDDLCHFLVLDGMPNQNSLADKSDTQRIPNSITTISPTIHEIEQGMGRTVRSKSDYSLIFLLGDKLQDFVSRHSNMFTPETQAQWKFFKQIAKDIKHNYSSIEESNKQLINLIEKVLVQDDSWIQLYKSKVQKIYKEVLSQQQDQDYTFEQAEQAAWQYALNKNYQEAARVISQTVTSDSGSNNGIKYELMATYYDKFDQQRAFDLQKKAHSEQSFLFKSPTSSYSKRTRKVGSEGISFYEYIKKYDFEDSNDLATHIRAINDDLLYTNYADETNFRASIQKLGELLGFDSSQPEAETAIKEGGPDNLWLDQSTQIVIEDKNRRASDEIFKGDVEQITTSSNWFAEKYQSQTFYSVIFHPSIIFASDAHTNFKVDVVSESKLQLLKDAIYKLADGICQESLNYWSAENLQNLFCDTKLLKHSFISTYTVPAKKK